MAYLFMKQRTPVFTTPLTFLHLAPEAELGRLLARLPTLRYVSGDIAARGTLRLDATRLPFLGGSVDFAYCSHMLNALADDRSALAELRRVLSPSGWALIQVPVERAITVEGPTPSTPESRRNAFGDPGVFRLYGRDIAARLEEAGFRVTADRFVDSLAAVQRSRWGLLSETLYVCRVDNA